MEMSGQLHVLAALAQRKAPSLHIAEKSALDSSDETLDPTRFLLTISLSSRARLASDCKYNLGQSYSSMEKYL